MMVLNKISENYDLRRILVLLDDFSHNRPVDDSEVRRIIEKA
jgi:hypothetical protein